MTAHHRIKLHQQRDRLLATLHYADEKEAERIKQLLNEISQRLAEAETLNKPRKAS